SVSEATSLEGFVKRIEARPTKPPKTIAPANAATSFQCFKRAPCDFKSISGTTGLAVSNVHSSSKWGSPINGWEGSVCSSVSIAFRAGCQGGSTRKTLQAQGQSLTANG